MERLAVHPLVMAARGLRGASRDAHARSRELARREADAVWFATVDEVDRTLSFKDDGHRTAACWVQAVTNCEPSDATRQVRVARMIRHLPAVGDALLVGHIGASQIDELLHLWRNRRVRDVLPALIDELIERASLMPVIDFHMVCQRVAAFADPDGAHRDHETSRANRHLSLVPDGAGFRLHAEGDALSGAIVQEVLDRYVQAEFDTDWAAGVAEHGDGMCPALLRRTHRQRQFDAFIEMTRAAAEAGVSGSVVTLVNIHCDQQTVEEAIRNGFADNGTEGSERNDFTARSGDPAADTTIDLLLRRRCDTTSGAPVDPQDLLIALLTGRVRTLVHARDGRVIELGRRQRFFVGAAREAALLAGPSCTVTGCSIVGGRVQIDHTRAWARTVGPTSQSNAGTICAHHNRIKEELGLTMQRAPTIPGVWNTFRCDGSQIGFRTSPAISPPASPPYVDSG